MTQQQANKQVAWSAERMELSAHARFLHQSLLKSEKAVWVLRQEREQLMEKHSGDAERLLEMQALLDSLKERERSLLASLKESERASEREREILCAQLEYLTSNEYVTGRQYLSLRTANAKGPDDQQGKERGERGSVGEKGREAGAARLELESGARARRNLEAGSVEGGAGGAVAGLAGKGLGGSGASGAGSGGRGGGGGGRGRGRVNLSSALPLALVSHNAARGSRRTGFGAADGEERDPIISRLNRMWSSSPGDCVSGHQPRPHAGAPSCHEPTHQEKRVWGSAEEERWSVEEGEGGGARRRRGVPSWRKMGCQV